jgi:flagellar biosynthesis protein FlhG
MDALAPGPRPFGERAAASWNPSAASVSVFASGKGGVGKSVLAIGAAAALARAGRRVLLVDGAQNLGNLHILLGVRPRAPLADVLVDAARPGDLLVRIEPGLELLPADSGAEALYALSAFDRARLHDRLSGLYDAFDAVIVDGGAGVEAAVRACAMRASRLVAVVVPEPASLADAYALVKLAHLQVPGLPVGVLVNRVEAPGEAETAVERLRLATRRFLGLELDDLGAVPESDRLRRAARRPGGVLDAIPPALEALAGRLAPAASPGSEVRPCPA